MKSTLNQLVISAIVAAILFNSIEVSWKIYMLVFCAQSLLVLINFAFSKNKSLFKSLVTINVVFFITYCTKQIIENGNPTQMWGDEIAFISILSSLIVTILFLFLQDVHQVKIESVKPILIEKRELDLKLLEHYVETFQIIGLNGRWGTGKTFLVNKLRERLKNQYEFIEIDLLTCNLHEMQSTLINEFEELLYRNRIIPKYANKMKKNISSASFISKIQDLLNLVLTQSDSKAEILKGFQQELKKLEKKIVVVYEDIDRINNPDVLREIFAISEKIANEHIKIIYQYDEQELTNLQFTSDYLEKYIPFKMNVTELHFKEILQFELQHIDRSILSIDDFNYLTLQDFRFKILTEFFDFGNEYCLLIEYIPIRKLQHMISEIVLVLQQKKGLYSKNKETIISFYLLKHLFTDKYEEININESLFETFNFSYEDKKYTITDLITLDSKDESTGQLLQNIFKNVENRIHYSILKLFNYELINPLSFKDTIRFEEVKLKAKHDNEKIDRIVWKLLFEGKSIFTDYEFAIHKMCEDVLSKPLADQKKAFEEFWGYFYYGNKYVLDHTTIFKLGIDPYLHLFECFKVVDVTEENRLRLIDFYFECTNVKTFNLDVLKCMNYNPLNTKKEYLKVISYLNELDIVCNFEKHPEFLRFLQTHMQALTRLSICHTWEYFDDYSKFDQENVQIATLEWIKTQLVNTKIQHQSLGIAATQEDLTIIIAFLDKLIEIIQCDSNMTNLHSREGVKVNLEGNRRHLEVFDRFRNRLNEETDLTTVLQDLNEGYLNGEISLYQITELVKGKE
ncbi:KAP family NTPase [Lysinibacillus xylanilyticus]|uniref:P-loop NTPase fold protein n=1 Tax=Lysinibacillus xylanilyticus TaxID=582475 RepID=UPI002B24688A|nr:P-loop NTPase fold protein [Lysinibacillus xylanilyticus]MEB2280042.1 KAP family NTPase [Lysinibacillus xylanilyticus]